ncbi:glycosyltransferase [Arthrobacter roseus]|uniref:glycosyltransferase n=1 Tax=Arthrobacter roseus TaxID=136274 RepID=UPI001964AF5E|nr:glycosyltransferase involved in cell wall biosynthesis [Arthrobacter roseus]
MHIVIDARFTRIDRHDGISRYGASLIAAVADTIASESSVDSLTMLISDTRQLELLPKVPYEIINSPLSPAELFVARRINRLKPDVVFCPMQTMGTFGRRYRLILTLHDLIYYDNPTPPRFLPLPVRLLWRLFHLSYWPQRLLLNRADVVATISNTTRDLIVQRNLTHKPVIIVGNAPQSGTRARDPHGSRQKTLIYMGSFMPYKNVETLIQAMRFLPGYSLHLLSRIPDARRNELEELLPPVDAAGASVRFHNGVSDTEYDSLLRNSTALVTLSRAEGYGLPVIEAMATGTPVIASDMPIFREVGGAAALYVDADSAHGVAEAVRLLDTPNEWGARSRAGIERASTYQWEDSARTFIEAARNLHAQSR